MTSSEQITVWLQRLRNGDAAAADQLLPMLYEELRDLAAHLMRGDRPGHTLQPTALVHEAWLKLERALGNGADVRDRQHFLAVATKAMRQVLINHARDRRSQKRGGGAARLPLDDCLDAVEAAVGDVVEIDDLLARLAVEHPRPAQVVEMRVFGGLLVEEVAAALQLAESTVKADWRFARAWLQQAMQLPEG
ncbi:MAG: sigma-70 family RNA polymerase sigma factor [Planctomycetes bacterium]|nr:sigma-70 family RNA polymerase sigma factor [Planctomycetota bacterium]